MNAERVSMYDISKVVKFHDLGSQVVTVCDGYSKCTEKVNFGDPGWAFGGSQKVLYPINEKQLSVFQFYGEATIELTDKYTLTMKNHGMRIRISWHWIRHILQNSPKTRLIFTQDAADAFTSLKAHPDYLNEESLMKTLSIK